jgi:ribose 5-phosphate isomerase B
MAELIPIGSDHAGVELKARLVSELQALGFEPEDVGTHSTESTDYPDYAHAVARRVAEGEVRRGVLLCGTGLGMSYAANRHEGVRAAVAWSPEVARLAREHNDANVLCLGSRLLDPDQAKKILWTFLETPFGGGRHGRRVEKIEPAKAGVRA